MSALLILHTKSRMTPQRPLGVNLDRTGEDHSGMNFRIALKADAASVDFAQQLRQLGYVGRDPSRLVFAEQFGR
jgi:hypothetical protein